MGFSAALEHCPALVPVFFYRCFLVVNTTLSHVLFSGAEVRPAYLCNSKMVQASTQLLQ